MISHQYSLQYITVHYTVYTNHRDKLSRKKS